MCIAWHQGINMFCCNIEESLLKFLFSISAAISLRPCIIFSESSFVMILCLPSIFACAMLPSISYLQRRLSKEMDSVKCSTIFDVLNLNLPAHGFFILNSVSVTLNPALDLFHVLIQGLIMYDFRC